MLCEPLFLPDLSLAANALKDEEGFLWFDGHGSTHPEARMSYICLWPIDAIRLMPGRDAAAHLREWSKGFQPGRLAGGPPFQGGAAGYIAYDFAHAFERRFVSRHPSSGYGLDFSFYDTILSFDHATGQSLIFSSGLAGRGARPDTSLARARIDALKSKISRSPPPSEYQGFLSWERTTSHQEYMEAVERTRAYIRAGDIYQANIAGLWKGEGMSRSEAFALYNFLKRRSPSPFSAFGVFNDRILLSLSPERLVMMDTQGRVRAEPIKGTAPRHSCPVEDLKVRQLLLDSEKDRAENVMIVDLMRNDLSRVCLPQSVEVSSLCRLETFSNLHHLVSTVEGELAPESDLFDLISAVFPGGSVTGAPKLRAMQIIDELEPASRGLFCGSLGWFSPDGAMDFSILIRSLDVTSSVTSLWAGAGITLLSDPASEAGEILLKADRFLNSGPPDMDQNA